MTTGKDAARDLRYGRQGGRWAPEPIDGTPAPKTTYGTAICSCCNSTYQFNPDRGQPAHCGRLACRARTDWAADDWAGRARMARARSDAHLELDDLDQLAIRRTTPT